jgi:hypothetical protein
VEGLSATGKGVADPGCAWAEGAPPATAAGPGGADVGAPGGEAVQPVEINATQETIESGIINRRRVVIPGASWRVLDQNYAGAGMTCVITALF